MDIRLNLNLFDSIAEMLNPKVTASVYRDVTKQSISKNILEKDRLGISEITMIHSPQSIVSPQNHATPTSNRLFFTAEIETLLSRAHLKACQNLRVSAEVSRIFQEQVRKYLYRQSSNSRNKGDEKYTMKMAARTKSLHEFREMLIATSAWQYERSMKIRDKLPWDERYADEDLLLRWFCGEIKMLREEDCKRLKMKNRVISQGIQELLETWRKGDGERRDPKVDRLEKWALRKMFLLDEKLKELREALGKVEDILRRESDLRVTSDIDSYRIE